MDIEGVDNTDDDSEHNSSASNFEEEDEIEEFK